MCIKVTMFQVQINFEKSSAILIKCQVSSVYRHPGPIDCLHLYQTKGTPRSITIARSTHSQLFCELRIYIKNINNSYIKISTERTGKKRNIVEYSFCKCRQPYPEVVILDNNSYSLFITIYHIPLFAEAKIT